MRLRGVVVVAGCLAALAAVVIALRPAPGQPVAVAVPAASVAPVPTGRLRWMGHWLGEDLRETLVREVAREFAFQHPGLTVELRFPQEIMGVRSPRLTGEFIAAQVRLEEPEWDVVWLDDLIYQEVADVLGDPEWGRHHLVDFRSLPGFASAHKPFILADPRFAAQTGGILVGPYIEGEYTVLWLNRALLGQLGLGYPERGATWHDLLRLAEGLAAKRAAGDTEAYLLPEAQDWLTSAYLFQGLLCSRLAEAGILDDPRPSPRRRAALREALDAFAALGRLQPLLPGHRERLWIDTRILPLQDRTLAYVAGTWMYSHWRGLDRARMSRMVPTTLPLFAEVGQIHGGYIPTWAVLKRAPGREAGIALLRHWSSPDVAERWVAYTKNPTGLRGDLAALRLSEDPFDRFMVDMEARTGPRIARANGSAWALGSGSEERTAPFHALLRELLEGAIDGETAWQRLCAIAGWQP